MTTDSVFILFKKTDFNKILACLGGKVYRWWGVHKFFVAKMGGGVSFINANVWKIWDPPSKENDSPLTAKFHEIKAHSCKKPCQI